MELTISKSYGDQVIFDQFNLVLEPEKIHVIVGPSGCGKTTLLQAIAGLTTYEGKITGFDRVSYVFQSDRLFPYLTVYKNLQLIVKDDTTILNLLERFEISEIKDKYPKQLSGGEKQRVAIIRAYLYASQVILMDEPFKSLDYDLKVKRIEEVMLLQKESNKTIILVTHDLDVAIYLGHVIHVLSQKVATVVDRINNPNQGQEEGTLTIRNRIKQHLVNRVS